MPRGRLDKVTMTAKVLKLKEDLFNQKYDMKMAEFASADHQLNLVLDIINEYGL